MEMNAGRCPSANATRSNIGRQQHTSRDEGDAPSSLGGYIPATKDISVRPNCSHSRSSFHYRFTLRMTPLPLLSVSPSQEPHATSSQSPIDRPERSRNGEHRGLRRRRRRRLTLCVQQKPKHATVPSGRRTLSRHVPSRTSTRLPATDVPACSSSRP